MLSDFTATRTSLFGVALLAACACGTAAAVSGLSGAGGFPVHVQAVYLPMVALASGLIVVGLWRRDSRAGLIGLAAVLVLMLANIFVPQMSIGATTQLSGFQIFGLGTYLLAGALLVAAFYSTYRFRNRGASLLAMSGAALAIGCNCCHVSMGFAGMAHTIAPSQVWLMQTPTIYSIAGILVAAGLYRIGGIVPALVAVTGQAIVLLGLRLPMDLLSPGPGLRLDFLVKYPIMLAGTSAVMMAFVLAYRAESKHTKPAIAVPEPAYVGD